MLFLNPIFCFYCAQKKKVKQGQVLPMGVDKFQKYHSTCNKIQRKYYPAYVNVRCNQKKHKNCYTKKKSIKGKKESYYQETQR